VNYSNLTLELAPGDAQRVAVASKAGDLRVMLRTAGNVDPFGLSVLSQDDLLRMNKPAHKGVSGVEFIIGGKG